MQRKIHLYFTVFNEGVQAAGKEERREDPTDGAEGPPCMEYCDAWERWGGVG